MPLKVGIIGAGFAAEHHAGAWKRNKAKIVAVADINRERAKQFALRIVEGERGYLLVNPTGKTLLKLSKSRRYVKNLLSLTPYLKLALEAAVGKTPRDAIAYNVKTFINYIKGVDALDAELLLNQVEAYEKILERSANS